MNREELSRMLDMVDEKFIAEIPMNDGAKKVTAIKRKSFHSGFACVAAAAVLILSLSVIVNTNRVDISVNEEQGAATDTEIILIDEVIEAGNYDRLFTSPLDLGGSICADYASGDKLWSYSEETVRDMLPYDVTALLGDRFSPHGEVVRDEMGEFSYANIYLYATDNSLARCTVAVSKKGGLQSGIAYAEKNERYGESVYTCYCEKTDGLHLWGFFEKDGTEYSLSASGLEKNEAGIILDSLITGSISFEGFTADNAESMRCTMPFEEALLLPEFEGKIITARTVGDMYLRDDDITCMKFFKDGKTACTQLYSAVYVYGSSAAAVQYYKVEPGFEADFAPKGWLTADISDITSEMLSGWNGNYDTLYVKSGDIYIGIYGDCSGETAMEILKEIP